MFRNILLLSIYLLAFPSLLAFEVKPNPSISVPQHKEVSSNKNRQTHTRLNIKIFNIRPNHKNQAKGFEKLLTLKHILRAKIEKPNHFYVGDYHIVTEPFVYSKIHRRLGMRLSFYQRFGTYKQLEESIGQMEIRGDLRGKGPIGHFVGYSQKIFKDKKGQPILEVQLGKQDLRKKPIAQLPSKGENLITK